MKSEPKPVRRGSIQKRHPRIGVRAPKTRGGHLQGERIGLEMGGWLIQGNQLNI